jgi:hypothetical protein
VNITFLEKTIHEIIVVELIINNISSINARRLKLRKEFKSSIIIGVDIGVKDLSIQTFVRNKEMDAVNVLTSLRLEGFLCMVLTIEFL